MYKRQLATSRAVLGGKVRRADQDVGAKQLCDGNPRQFLQLLKVFTGTRSVACLLYTSDAADERSSVDLGGRRIIKKKNDLPLHG